MKFHDEFNNKRQINIELNFIKSYSLKMELPELISKRSTKSILSKESTKRAKLTFPALFRYIRGRNLSVGRNSAVDSSNLLRPIPLSTDKKYLRSRTRKKFNKVARGSMIRLEQKEDLLEEKLNLFIHPYNHSVTVRNHMTFDEREKNAAKALESIGKLDNKWAFVKDFIFQQNKDQFREVCYNANKKLYDKFNVNGIWKKFFKLTKSSKDVLNIGVLPPAKWKRSPGKMRRHYKYYKGLKRRSVASSRDSSGKKSSLQPDSSLTKSKFSKEKSPEPSMNNITEENVSVNDCNNLDLKVQKVFKKNTEAKERKSSKNYLFNMKGKKKYNKKNSLVPPTKMKTLGIEVKNYFRKPDSSIIENQSERISKLIDTHEEIHKNLKIGKFHRVH